MNQILLHKFHQFCCRRRLHFPCGGGDADLKGRGSVERQCDNRSIPCAGSSEVLMTKDEWYRQLFERLDNSKFRSSFHLKQKDIDYIHEKGLDTIRQHVKEFIAKREAPAYIANDGKQTPMKGHPVFIAQHATATCCRECIRKWHKMQPGKELSQVQQDYLVDVIMTWIQREMERQEQKI